MGKDEIEVLKEQLALNLQKTRVFQFAMVSAAGGLVVAYILA